MTASVLQERESSSSAGGANIALAFASNVTAGSAIHVFGTVDAGANFAATPVTDTLGNSYGSILDNVVDTGVNQRVGQAVAQNSGGGANTVTVAFSVSTTFRGIWIREIGGVTTTPLDGHNGQFQATPGTGTDGLSSGTATDANQPVLMSALSCGTSGATAPTAGTGFSSTTTGWAAIGGTRTEHQRFTSTATRAATLTAAANSGHCTLMAMFDESGGGATVTPLPILPITQAMNRAAAF